MLLLVFRKIVILLFDDFRQVILVLPSANFMYFGFVWCPNLKGIQFVFVYEVLNASDRTDFLASVDIQFDQISQFDFAAFYFSGEHNSPSGDVEDVFDSK